jgi:hypothetical protein
MNQKIDSMLADLQDLINIRLLMIQKDFRKDIHTLARSTGQYLKVVRK